MFSLREGPSEIKKNVVDSTGSLPAQQTKREDSMPSIPTRRREVGGKYKYRARQRKETQISRD